MQTIEVAAGIIWRDGCFLAAKRPEGKPRGGFWEFPGGKLEPGESREEALERELREELGICCTAIRFRQTLEHAYPDVRVCLHFMDVTAFDGEPQPYDGQELRWVTPEQALGLAFLPADRDILEALHRQGG